MKRTTRVAFAAALVTSLIGGGLASLPLTASADADARVVKVDNCGTKNDGIKVAGNTYTGTKILSVEYAGKSYKPGQLIRVTPGAYSTNAIVKLVLDTPGIDGKAHGEAMISGETNWTWTNTPCTSEPKPPAPVAKDARVEKVDNCGTDRDGIKVVGKFYTGKKIRWVEYGGKEYKVGQLIVTTPKQFDANNSAVKLVLDTPGIDGKAYGEAWISGEPKWTWTNEPCSVDPVKPAPKPAKPAPKPAKPAPKPVKVKLPKTGV